jgi:hypothetical protein
MRTASRWAERCTNRYSRVAPTVTDVAVPRYRPEMWSDPPVAGS